MSKVKSIVVPNMRNNPIKKIVSAIFSYRKPLGLELLKARNEKILLAISDKIVIAVNSSIIVVALTFKIFNEVNTTKQIPSKLEEAFKICGDFSGFIFLNRNL